MKKVFFISLVAFSFIVIISFCYPNIDEKHIFEAESATPVKGAFKMADDVASGKYLVSLTRPGDGFIFNHMPGAGKLAIRYSSLAVGLINVSVNNKLIQQVNVHSSRTKGLDRGKHVIRIVNRGPGPVSIDALIVGDTK